ncbi:MAG: hypothetical protein MK116_04530 [Phycisphaerales bacterium]|nr:hypothetical protein [Phycisphaerales bacterium]
MASRRSNSRSTATPRWHRRLLSASGGMWQWSRTRTGRTTWTAVGVLALLLATVAVIPTLSRRVERPVDQVEVRFSSLPGWAGPSLLDHVTSLAESRLNGTTLARGDLQAVHQDLLDSGFFEVVSQVRRSGTDEITVDATLVTPMAKVRDRHGTALIDTAGNLMPPGCGVSGDVHVVTITNPRYSRPTRPRQTWTGGDVAAAIRVLKQISGAAWIDQVEAIDLTKYAASGSLVLVTDNGSRIVWGSAPGAEKAMESLQEWKIERLDELHRLSGRIDQYHSGEIDITDASVVIKR